MQKPFAASPLSPVHPASTLYSHVHKKIAHQTHQRKNFDVIVIGVGSMGSSTCYYLANQGYTVLGLEQFDIPHEKGSHAGQTRIIRKAYFEHPDYVPLLEAAYKNWTTIEEESGIQLYHKTGLMYFGKADNILISGVRDSAKKYGVEVNDLSTEELKKQFPQFAIPIDYERLIEPDAGFLTPERAILVYVEQAIQNGATIKTNEQMLSYRESNAGFEVKSNKGTYSCKKIIITAGPWAGELLPSLKSQLKVTRQMLTWVNPKKSKSFELGEFPCWTFAHPDGKGLYYGFPIFPTGQFGPPIGLKVAHHFPGKITHPSQVIRTINHEEEQDLIHFLNEFVPDGYESTHTTKTCLYTNSPDNNFIIDHHPSTDNIVLASGFSGHGFKFASVVGEILADLAMEEKTSLPIGFLSATRFE